MIFRAQSPFRAGISALILAFILATFSGCASRDVPLRNPEDIYSGFRAEYGNCNSSGVNLRASLYYSSEGEGHRTTMHLWGERHSPLRLDVRAGVGAYIAHIKQDSEGLTAFYPKQETAYLHRDPVRGAQILGLPFPFGLKQLTGFMTGCFPNLIPPAFDSAGLDKLSGNIIFTFQTGPISSITLEPDGRPVSLTGRGNTGWDLSFASFAETENGRQLPDTLILVTEKGDKAILRIKSREFNVSPWPEKSMKMGFPDNTEIIRLDTDTYVRVPARKND